MKILFDHLCFWQRFGGVARYFVELHRHLPAECSELTVRFSDNSYLREAGIAVHPFLGRWEFRGKARLEKQWGKIVSCQVNVLLTLSSEPITMGSST